MEEMARREKELQKLSICRSEFIEYKDIERDVIFEKVEYLCLINPKLDPNYFKQIVNMFPNTKRLIYLP